MIWFLQNNATSPGNWHFQLIFSNCDLSSNSQRWIIITFYKLTLKNKTMFQIQKLSTQIVKTVESQILFLLSYLRNMLKLSNKPTHTKILEQISRFWQVICNKFDHSEDDKFYLYYWNEKTTQVLGKVDEIRLLQFLLCDSLYPNINVNAMFISAQT